MMTNQTTPSPEMTESKSYQKAISKAISKGKSDDFAQFYAYHAQRNHTLDHAWALALLREYLLMISKNKSYISDAINWIEKHIDNISAADLMKDGRHYHVVYDALLHADQLEYA